MLMIYNVSLFSFSFLNGFTASKLLSQKKKTFSKLLPQKAL